MSHHTPQIYDESYYIERCNSYNLEIGSLDKEDSYNCEYCLNKGILWSVKDGEIYAYNCPQCYNIRRSIRLLKSSGLENLTFDTFNTPYEWQQSLFGMVYEFADNNNGEWLYIGGQSGSGKTHLCTAAIHHIIFTQQRYAVLMKWAEVSKLLKGMVNDSSYSNMITCYKDAEVLYIDDFFKVKKGEYIKPADINLAFELIDHRYCNKLTTIISSEFSLDEIIASDEATGSRIRQMAGKYALNIRADKNKNYRLR